ncbi:hypothetical protein BJX65DRAFT_63282 [Aspergillus insuetus]
MPLDISALSCWTSADIHAAKSCRRTAAKSSPSRLKASSRRLVSSTPLINLPSEILLAILSYSGNLNDLFSIILTCKRFFNIFQTAQQSLIQSTFARYACLKSDRVIYKGLIQLRQIIFNVTLSTETLRDLSSNLHGSFSDKMVRRWYLFLSEKR